MLVFVNVGNVIVQSGLNTSLVQSDCIDDSDLSTVFWLSFGTSAALFLVVFFAAPAIANFYTMPQIVWQLRALGLLLLITAFNSVQVAVVQRELQLRKVFNAKTIQRVKSWASLTGKEISPGDWLSARWRDTACNVVGCIAHARRPNKCKETCAKSAENIDFSHRTLNDSICHCGKTNSGHRIR